MRRFDGLAHFLAQFGEKLPNDIVCRKSVRVVGLKILLANSAALVDIEKSRVRHPFGHPLRFSVKDVKTANDLGIWIGQQRKLNIVPLSEVHEDSRAIV